MTDKNTSTYKNETQFSREEKPVLALILLCYFMIILDSSIVFTAIPVMKSSLGLDNTHMAWIQDAYTLTFGGTLLLGAQLGDVLGRTRVFATGLALFGLASFAVGSASTPAILITARAVQGAGAAIVAPTSLTLITAVFTSVSKRHRATAAYGTMAGIGSSAGRLIGGLVATFLSWRFGFWINVPITVVALVLARRYLPDFPSRPGRFDIVGAVVTTMAMFALTWALVENEWWPAVVGVVLLLAVVWWERRVEAPIIPEHLWRHRVRGTILLARMCFAAALFGMFFFVTQYFELSLGYSALGAGVLFLINCVPQGIAGLQVRRIIRRWNLAVVLLVGLMSICVGLFLIGIGMRSTELAVLLVGMALTGVGQGLGFGPITSLGVWNTTAEEAGAASGLVNTAHQMGATIGVAALTALFRLTPDYGTMLLAAAGTMLFCLVLAVFATTEIRHDSHV